MIEWVISSGALILVVTALRFLLRGKISLRLQYALWGLVLLRLLVPVSVFESGFSVMNAAQKAPIIYAAGRVSNMEHIEYTADGNIEGYHTTDPTSDFPAVVAENATVKEYEFMERLISVRGVLIPVWLCGAVVMLIIFIVSNRRFSSRISRTSEPLEEKRSILPVMVTGAIETPCLFGVVSPTIYVTPKVADHKAVLEHILAHETTHYRHRDHIWAILRCLCLILHWYDPLVWLAAALSRRDAELACDEGTLKHIGEEERIDYGRTLIGLTCTARGAAFLTATTMTGSKSGIKERITLIAQKPKMAAGTLIAVLLIVVAAAGCTFTGAIGDGPWQWAKKLSTEDIDRATVWIGLNEYDLSAAETEEVISTINRLNRFDFRQNSRLEGSAPGSGLILACGEKQYCINQAGDLEMSYGGKQWWIRDEPLDTMLASLLAENITPEQIESSTNARGWIAGMDNLRINVYAGSDAQLLVENAVISESGETLYSARGNQIGTVWSLGDSGRKMYALYNGDYEIIADGEVKIEYMDSGYFDKVVEYTYADGSALYHIGNYSSMKIDCEAIGSGREIQPFRVYTESELDALNKD